MLAAWLGGAESSLAAPSSDTLHVVNWNIEYFGDSAHHNPAVQTAGLRTLMKAIDADVYAFCEVVDVDSFASVVNSLPGNYGYVVSGFGSFAASTSSPGYAVAQKLGFVYRKGRVRNLHTRALLATSSTAYYNFSSGRFPYEVATEVLGRDGAWRPVTFIVVHAKAFTDNQSCTRRVDGCQELKDTLDANYSRTSFLILGDLNDDLDTSICASFPASNYAVMVKDSIHYRALTLPISRAGAFSIDGYSSLIDHVIASDEMARFYVPNSAEVLRAFVKAIDPAYDNNISDHFPVRTAYVINAAATTVKEATRPGQIKVFPNPAQSFLRIEGNGDVWKNCMIYDVSGRVLLKQAFPQSGMLDLPQLKAGMYLLYVEGAVGNVARQMFLVGQ